MFIILVNCKIYIVNLPFLPEKMVVNNTKKLICNLQDKNDYVVHINVLKQALDHGLKLIKVHQVIEFVSRGMVKGIY